MECSRAEDQRFLRKASRGLADEERDNGILKVRHGVYNDNNGSEAGLLMYTEIYCHLLSQPSYNLHDIESIPGGGGGGGGNSASDWRNFFQIVHRAQ